MRLFKRARVAERGKQGLEKMEPLTRRIELMTTEIDRTDALYRPSDFWKMLNEANVKLIDEDGFENFKRTINLNYFNWMPNSFDNNQLRRLLTLWSQNPSSLPLRVTTPADRYTKSWEMKNWIETDDQRRTYAFYVGLLWWYTSSDDPSGLTRVLTEPSLGNPIPTTLDGRPISQDLANSIGEYNAIHSTIELPATPVFIEVGAGYGRVAYVCLKARPCRYLIFDIPPALAVSERYLSMVLPDHRVFRFRRFERFEEIADELDGCSFGFFTPNQLALFPSGYADVAIAISALHEMRVAQISNYMELFSRVAKSGVYMKNWKTWHNPVDDIVVDGSLYDPGEGWRLALGREHPVQDLFKEKVFTRIR